MRDFLSLVERDFQPTSDLARGLTNYRYREEQVALAREIAETMEHGRSLLAEAETGTGKTLAYLIPALRSDAKILISTHTRALQDQLMHRDVPAVIKALGIRRRIALLKGRSNYLCPHRLNRHLHGQEADLWHKKLLLRVQEWAEQSKDGDLAELPFDAFERGVGGMVTSTAEQCTGSKCPEYHRCPLMKARAKAQEADIVISNHSLLLADAALKSGEYGEVLPAFDAYVLDEAHNLPQLAGQYFGVQLSRLKLIQWLNDMQAELEGLGDESALKDEVVAQGRLVLDAWLLPDRTKLREAWLPVLELAKRREERSDTLLRLSERAGLLAEDIESVISPPEGFVGWEEGDGENRRHVVAPVETGPVLTDNLWERPASFVLLSATLRVSGSFEYARNRFGLPDAEEAFHPSPFDYGAQALTYIPRHLPSGGSEASIRALTDEMEALLKLSQGRAFVLFTSYYVLNQVAPELAKRLPWTVLEQGRSGSRDAILEAFRSDTHSILCGTRSFWEGVDVPGEALSMVVIDKMPFTPPNDPLLTARINACEEKGGSGFRDIQLPEAIAVLRQGVGRLIRTSTDRGVMAILDSRIYQKSYGRVVAHNLPPAPITADIDDVRSFFK